MALLFPPYDLLNFNSLHARQFRGSLMEVDKPDHSG